MAAIEWLVQNFQQRTGIACVLEADEDLELAEPYATAVFRMVQESLANIGKHSHAAQARVINTMTTTATVARLRRRASRPDRMIPGPSMAT